MMMCLPNEIIELILWNLPFEKLVLFHLDFKFIVYKKYNVKIHTWIWAAGNGHLEVVKWLHLHRPEGCTSAMAAAAENGHLEVVKWLHLNRPEGCAKLACAYAAKDGHLEIVKWLHLKKSKIRTKAKICIFNKWPMDFTWNWPAKNGHLEVLKWLHLNNIEGCSDFVMEGAAENGHLDVVKWLHDIGSSCTRNAMEGAAGNGHLDVVKWLHENSTKFAVTKL
jgi:hypothetical protein